MKPINHPAGHSVRAGLPKLITALFLSSLLSLAPVLISPIPVEGQKPASELSPASAVAQVVRWTGTLPESAGKTVDMHFGIYENASGGLALWTESQRVQIGSDGHYSVLLGATSSEGLPQALFPVGESRWVAAHLVSVAGKSETETAAEAPRSLLAAVPYAFKSVDAASLAGIPAADYVTHEELRSFAAGITFPGGPTSGLNIQPAISGTGTTNYLPIWTNSTTFGNSALYQTAGSVGIGTTSPTATLDVNGGINVRGILTMPTGGVATKTAGFSSHSIQFGASTFSSTSATAIAQNFKLQAISVGNNTSSPSSAMALLYGVGSNTPALTGFSIGANGKVTFVSGQTFPGTGPGTITKIATTTPLTGGATSGTATLGLSTSALETILNPVYARLTAADNFTGNLNTTGSIGIGTTGPDAPLDIEAPNVGQALLISAGGADSWAINSFGGSGSDGLAGRFVAGPGGSGLGVGGGSTSDSTTAGLGASISGGYSYDGEGGDGIDVYAGNIDYGTREGYAGYFSGDVKVTGNIFGGAKYFSVDHPTDPTNKYLNHVSTESSEMMNIYSGNVTTDEQGLSTVSLPAWFEKINTDFRYQLTVVGQFSQAIIKNKIDDGKFTIMTNAPRVEVSWMITAVRNDRYAQAHPLVVEQMKPANERGFYVHPELYGQPATRQSEWGRHPRQMNAKRQMMKDQASRTAGPLSPKNSTLSAPREELK